MSHVRAQIRDYVRARLTEITGLETAVEIDSEKIPDDVPAPFVLVSLGPEAITQRGLGAPGAGRKNERQMDLTVDVYSRALTEPILKAEDYAAAIEAKLSSAPQMGGLTRDLRLVAYTPERIDEGKQPIARLRMQWAVIYFTNERDATVAA